MQTHKEVTVMSTRSFICTYDADKKAYKAIYCHFDGYIKWVGAMLDANYDTESKVDALLDLGDISSLEVSVEATKKNVYEDSEPCYIKDIEEAVKDSAIEFVYLYVSKGLWRVYMVGPQLWGYLPSLLEAQGISSHFTSRWDKALNAAKDGDCYEQIKQAERDGKLVDLILDTLDRLTDFDYEIFKRSWSEIWASYNFYKEEN